MGSSPTGDTTALETGEMPGKMSLQNLRSLRSERDRIQTELGKAQAVADTLRGELRATDRAIAIVEGQSLTLTDTDERAPAERRAGRGVVKDIVLSLVVEHADAGVKTTDVVGFAKTRGTDLDRNSVASLLSRLAKEGVLVYDRETRRYKPAPKAGVTQLRSVL